MAVTDFFQFAQKFLNVNCRKKKSDRCNYLILKKETS